MNQLKYKKKIFFFSESRSEFYLLKTIHDILKYKYDVQFIIAGLNTQKDFVEFNNKYKKNRLKVIKIIDLKSRDTDNLEIASNFSNLFKKISFYLNKNKPDLLIVLGDRILTLCCTISASLFSTKILHFHGGEITQGSKDDVYRHLITKISNFHFTSTKDYKNRIIQLGEEKKNIINVGSIGAGVAKKFYDEFKTKNRIKKIDKLIVCINSESNNIKKSRKNLNEILIALNQIKDYSIHFTLSNYDVDTKYINNQIKKFCLSKKNAKYTSSLGQIKFFKEIINSRLLIGNTSSGLIEVPSLKTPTLNIGDRQKGRTSGKSVFNCKADRKTIFLKIKQIVAMSKKNTIHYTNPYLKKNNLKIIKNTIDKLININTTEKKFIDLKF